MRHRPASIIDTSPLEALRASTRAWLVETLLWLIETLAPLRTARFTPAWLRRALSAAESELDRDLRDAADELRRMLLVSAFARLNLPPAPRGHARPLSHARHTQRNSFVRKCTSIALKRLHVGSLRERAQRLRDAYDSFDTLTHTVFAHMAKMFARPRLPGLLLVITHDAPATRAPAPALASADTS